MQEQPSGRWSSPRSQAQPKAKGRFPDRGQALNDVADANWATMGAGFTPAQDARDLWVGYLTDYSVDTGSQGMYCPLMPAGAGLTYEEAWPRPDGVYQWGYAYLGNAKDDWRWQGSEPPPGEPRSAQ